MATKFSALTALTASAAGDFIPLVDVSDTTDAATGTTKYITRADLLSAVVAPVWGIATLFETAARFTATVASTGTVTHGTTGVVVKASATGGSTAKIVLSVSDGFLDGSFYTVFNSLVRQGVTAYTNGEWCNWASDATTVAAAGITYTNNHIGWRNITTASVSSYKATNANGTTETSTAINTTASPLTRSTCVKNGTTNVKFYSGGNTIVLDATHTTNIPAEGNISGLTAGFSNRNNADDGDVGIGMWELRVDNIV